MDFTFSLPWLWITIFLAALVNVAIFGPLVIALPILVRDVLLASAATYGLISAAVGAGELAGGVLAGQLRVRRSGIVIYGWAIVCGLAIAAMGLAPSLAPILVRDVLLGGAATYGLISAMIGVGELVGGILMGQLRVKRAGWAMYGWQMIGGLTIAAIGFAPVLPLVLVLAVLLGASLSGFGVLWETALQRHVPRDLLGRVTSVDFFGAILLAPVAPLVFGGLVERVGPAPMFVASGAAVVVLCLAALLVPSIRNLD